jgi:hypothetical protein
VHFCVVYGWTAILPLPVVECGLPIAFPSPPVPMGDAELSATALLDVDLAAPPPPPPTAATVRRRSPTPRGDGGRWDHRCPSWTASSQCRRFMRTPHLHWPLPQWGGLIFLLQCESLMALGPACGGCHHAGQYVGGRRPRRGAAWPRRGCWARRGCLAPTRGVADAWRSARPVVRARLAPDVRARRGRTTTAQRAPAWVLRREHPGAWQRFGPTRAGHGRPPTAQYDSVVRPTRHVDGAAPHGLPLWRAITTQRVDRPDVAGASNMRGGAPAAAVAWAVMVSNPNYLTLIYGYMDPHGRLGQPPTDAWAAWLAGPADLWVVGRLAGTGRPPSGAWAAWPHEPSALQRVGRSTWPARQAITRCVGCPTSAWNVTMGKQNGLKGLFYHC